MQRICRSPFQLVGRRAAMPAVGLVALAEKCNFWLQWLLWEARRKGAHFHFFFFRLFQLLQKVSCTGVTTMELAAETEVSTSM